MERKLLLGNEAIARGCVEAGVAVATTYPGTPSSEIGHVLDEISGEFGLYFEYSTNEKVALEMAAAAAASGLRSFVFMKHVGVNVASDPLVSLGYVSVRGGMVVLSADDPSMHSSQNEQDNRHYARLANLPMLEPSTPAEAKEMTIAAFDLSEKLQCPVFLRTTTRVNHARGLVPIGERSAPMAKGHFEKDAGRFVPVPAIARQMRLRQLERNKLAAEMSEKSVFNRLEGNGDIGIVASGVAYTYAKEFLNNCSILRLGMTNPLPERLIADFINGKRRVVVIEELDPLLEDEVLRIAGQRGIAIDVIGKRSGDLPMAFEYSPDTLLALKGSVELAERNTPVPSPNIALPSRPPVLCAGCPHRATFYAVKKALGSRDAIFSSDIGCYTLGLNPPMNMADFLLCMGSSVGAAGGFAQSTDQKVIAFIGDSTLFHSGIPGIVNAVFNDHRYLLIVMDNRTTAMTGHQPNPGTGRTGPKGGPPIEIEPLIRACGVMSVRTVDPYDVKAMTSSVKEALEKDELSVIIARRACPLAVRKKGGETARVCVVDRDKCTLCKTCVGKFACPAMRVKDGRADIDATICTGCGACVTSCPKGAIGVSR
ncbi:MAG TPA: indolepyruvate ferredoxin oxidoreductase subunit alpha [Methanomassiliicoccales archaeon]|nr:indolepyruvate ferredoxin oxidoreductase subunit alpha [Methanomassiliicoccales archaeon]